MGTDPKVKHDNRPQALRNLCPVTIEVASNCNNVKTELPQAALKSSIFNLQLL